MEAHVLQASALCLLAGVPIYWEGPPGDGKTSMQKALMRWMGVEPVELVGADLSPERVAGYPVPVDGEIRYIPDQLMRLLASGGRGLVISEVNTLPPETVSAILELVRVGRMAGENRFVPVALSGNPPHMASGPASPLGAALVNRVARFEYRGDRKPQVQAMEHAREAASTPSALFQGSFTAKGKGPFLTRPLFDQVEEVSWERYLLQGAGLPPVPEEGDLPALLAAHAKARAIGRDFLERGPDYELPQSDREDAPFFSRRSLEGAVRFLTLYLWARGRGWTPSEDVLFLGITAIMGQGAGSSFVAMAQEASDLPSPEEVLANPSLFPSRPDREALVGKALVRFLKERDDPSPGLALAEALAGMGREESALRLFASLAKAFPGVKPGPTLARALGRQLR